MPKVSPGVEGFTGYWGSGKTLIMVRSVLREVAIDPAHTLVINNFGMYGDMCFHVDTIDDIIALACLDLGDEWFKIVAVDEIGGLLRARATSLWPPAGDTVFQQGRKLRLLLKWTTQNWKYTDVNVRRVTSRVTDCIPWFPVVSNPGEPRPEYRPRIISCHVHDRPDPENAVLPKKPTSRSFQLFDWEAARSYDTKRLIQSSLQTLQDQQELARDNPLVNQVNEFVQVYEPHLPAAAKRRFRTFGFGRS